MSIAFPANTSLRVNTPCSDLPLFRYSYLFMPPLGVAYKPVGTVQLVRTWKSLELSRS